MTTGAFVTGCAIRFIYTYLFEVGVDKALTRGIKLPIRFGYTTLAVGDRQLHHAIIQVRLCSPQIGQHQSRKGGGQMNAMEFVQASVLGLHHTLLEDMKDLSQEVLEWRPQENANPIGFIFIHYMKTEDNIVHRLQNEAPIWESDEWRERLATNELPDTVKQHERPGLLPLSPSLSYAQQVMDNTRKFLETLDDSKLDIAPDPNRPRRTIGVILRAFLLSHGWWHAGEIKYLKGLQGMPQHA